MEVKYINPFINASMKVFSTFAGLTSSPGTPSVRTRPQPNKDINGFIGLNGHGITGYFIINFATSFLEKIMAGIFDHSTSTKEDLFDLAGELTNMITGSAKADLSQKGFFFDVAVPRISHATPAIPADLEKNPIIVVPFDTPAGKFQIEASIQTIDEDFQQDTMPEVAPPDGFISVDEFAKRTRMDPLKVRRLLKTGFLSGKKISNRQWHIPERQLFKIQGYREPEATPTQKVSKTMLDETLSVEEFAKLTRLRPAKVKSFLRSGFLKGILDEKKIWHIKKSEVAKFNKNA